jgi:NADH-quinone oxidoreductase subunit L
MLVPLAALSVGAVLAGMIWYKPFFGDHESVAKFFGMPVHAAAEEGHGAAAEGAESHAAAPSAETHAAEPAADGHGAAPAAEGHGATAVASEAAGTEEPAAPPAVMEGPIGAIYMAPDNHVMDEAHHAPSWVKASPFVAMLIGLSIAYLFYIVNPELPKALARQQRYLYAFLLNKWYFDELYDAIFVRPALWLGRTLWKRGDGATIDGGINGLALGIIPFVTRLAGRAQSGYLFHYAFAMVLGLVALTLWLGVWGPR